MQNARSATYLITGATCGIGLATARALSFMIHNDGGRLLVHGRNREKALAAAAEIQHDTGHARIDAVWGDLSSLEEVRALASSIQLMTKRLDVLINNAGVFMPRLRLTVDGFETTFAVNVLAPFLLTNLLVGLMEAEGDTPAQEARIVFVSSEAHRYGHIDFGNLEAKRRYDAHEAYDNSKLAEILLANAFARRLHDRGITSSSLHPGVIRTKLLQAGFPGSSGAPPDVGAKNLVYAATSEDLVGVTGRYYVNSRAEAPSPTARDQELGEMLWNTLASLTDWSEPRHAPIDLGAVP